MAKQTFLERLQLPKDLKKLNENQLQLLCWEIRQKLVCTVSQTGGHLASNLGIVELAVALHIVFDAPADAILWDVGHQCYPHKILTGRIDRFHTIRQEDGLSGFPRPGESEYDAFIAGHASTSLSAACGIAEAKRFAGDRHHTVAVVGDGALTGGMIYEALNNAGRSGDRLIMILNDNDMSISPSVGAFARYLAGKRSSNSYLKLKDNVENTLVKIPVVGKGLRNTVSNSKAAFRQLIYHSNLFEDLGFLYLGPANGHDLPLLVRTLRHAKELNKPVIVHVNTVKGKGYTPAEQHPARYHGVGGFDLASGELPPSEETFSHMFGEKLCELATADASLCAITAAMERGTGLSRFAKTFANRFFDVGIAEEHAVTFACGLASGGMRPVFAVYSTFLQRCYDQLIHDASIHPQHIVLAVDRAGLIGDDGETHQGLFDAAMLSQIPGMAVYSPASFAQLDYALDQAIYHTAGPAAVRYPRGGEAKLCFLPEGDFTHLHGEEQLLLVTYGRQIGPTSAARELLASEGIESGLLLLNRISPIPDEAVSAAKRYRVVLFLEEGVKTGGIGEHLLCSLMESGWRGRMQIQAVKQPFLPQMTVARALDLCGLNADAIAQTVRELL